MDSGFIGKIKSMEIQGAVDIAYHSLRHLKGFAKANGFGKKFDSECRKILMARPTAVPVYNVIEELKKEKSLEKIDEMIKEMNKAETKIAENGRKLFSKKSAVMTHCHSHEVVCVLKASKSRISNVFVTETEPKDQGLLTARELKKERIPFTFIVDSAAGFYMPKTDMVVVGSDALRKEGCVNKIGTLTIAQVAGEFRKPFYVAASTLKIDRREHIKIEMRNPHEVTRKEIRTLNPAFDITPWKYVKAVVTEKGVLKPKEIVKMI